MTSWTLNLARAALGWRWRNKFWDMSILDHYSSSSWEDKKVDPPKHTQNQNTFWRTIWICLYSLLRVSFADAALSLCHSWDGQNLWVPDSDGLQHPLWKSLPAAGKRGAKISSLCKFSQNNQLHGFLKHGWHPPKMNNVVECCLGYILYRGLYYTDYVGTTINRYMNPY